MDTDRKGKEDSSMPTTSKGLKHEEVTDRILAAFYEVYRELGHGFLESVYERALEIVLQEKGLRLRRQVPVPVYFRGQLIGEFCADMFIEECVIAELKAAKAIDPAHHSQLLNYLKATRIEVGMILNFGAKPEFKRMVFDNERKTAIGAHGDLASSVPVRVNPRSSAADLSSTTPA